MKFLLLYCVFPLMVVLPLLFIAGSAKADSSCTIIGTVLDEEGNPIEGALVSTEDIEVTTNHDGTFQLDDLPEGTHTITASAEGYVAATEEIYHGESPSNVAVTITITLSECTICPLKAEAFSFSVSQDEIILAKEDSTETIISVVDDTGCPVEGVRCKRILSAKNADYISVTPRSTNSDENGQATFTITAKKKTGTAKVKFKVKGIDEKLTVAVTIKK